MNEAIANLTVEDPALAAQLVEALSYAGMRLTGAVPSTDAPVPADQRRLIAQAVGTVVGMDMHDMLMVLLRQHPQLDRHGLLGPANGEIQ